MNCEEAKAHMSASLDGALSPAEEEALAAHLAICPACADLMKTLQGLDTQLATLHEPAPEGLKKGVLYRIDQASGKAKPARRGWFGPGTALGAVAAVLVLLVGLKVIPLDNRAKSSAPDSFSDAQPNLSEAYFGENAAFEPEAKSEQPEGLSNAGSEVKAPDPAADGSNYTYAPPLADAQSRDGASRTENYSAAPQTDDAVCSTLSTTEDAAVLLYRDFPAESLFSLLEAEEPKLYALVAELEPEIRDGLLCYRTDCGTALAIQEWLLAMLPQDGVVAEDRLTQRMEALDPGSASLYRILSWTEQSREILWPSSWPADWAERLQSGESWALFFPREDYVPNSGKTAYLVFSEN